MVKLVMKDELKFAEDLDFTQYSDDLIIIMHGLIACIPAPKTHFTGRGR